MADHEDDQKTWPPTPSAPSQNSERWTPFLTVILVMWGITAGQAILQAIGQGAFAATFGFAGFVLAVFLVTRDDRAALNNGALRLFIAVLGILLHLIQTR